jgi:hypothetical protein
VTVDELAVVLKELGCPPDKCAIMAGQLDRRARMDADRQKISHEAARQHLLGLMAQGWAVPKK